MSAVISNCGNYRYRLERDLAGIPGARTMAFIMVNPSTADATTDDATIRKCTGFAMRHGFGRLVVGNKFAFRATDVKELRTAADPIGCENDRHVEQIMRDANLIVVAWGPLAKLPHPLRGRWVEIDRMAQRLDVGLFCLGRAGDGQPRHPLMQSYNTPLTEWSVP